MPDTKRITSITSTGLLFCYSALILSFVVPFLTPLPARSQTPPLRQPGFVVVNSASMDEITNVTPGSLVTIFGIFKTQNNTAFSAASTPLPDSLGGLTVKLNTTACLLSYVSPTQINLYIPETVKDLLNTYQTYPLTISDAAPQTFTRQVGISDSLPGIFTVQANGQGTAVGQITNGTNAPTNIFNSDGSPKELEITTDGKQNYVTLYGTGFRFASTRTPNDANGVAEVFQATIGGVNAELTYVGPQGQYAGLDQINLKLPLQAAGLGVVKVRMSYSLGLSSYYSDLTNPVMCKMGGAPPPITARLVPEGLLPFDGTGELTRGSQVMKAANGSVYFFDAWRYKASQKGTSITFRTAFYSPLVLIYKIGTDQSLQFVAASTNTYDSRLGGIIIGGTLPSTQLLVTALPDAGDYLIFVTTADNSPETTGQYQFTLNTKVTELATTNLPLTQQAKLDSTDLATPSGAALDAYWWAGNKGDKLAFEATAAAFRPVLWIVKADGTTIASTGGSLSTTPGIVQLTATLPETGNYVLVTTANSPYLVGAYSFTMQRVASLTGAVAENTTTSAHFVEAQSRIERLGARQVVVTGENNKER